MSESRQSSPPLTEDEWIILLDLYLTYRPKIPAATHPVLLEASHTLGGLARILGRQVGPSFRPPSGLKQRMTAFVELERVPPDPAATKIVERVWGRYASNPSACRALADRIRERANSGIGAAEAAAST